MLMEVPIIALNKCPTRPSMSIAVVLLTNRDVLQVQLLAVPINDRSPLLVRPVDLKEQVVSMGA